MSDDSVMTHRLPRTVTFPFAENEGPTRIWENELDVPAQPVTDELRVTAKDLRVE